MSDQTRRCVLMDETQFVSTRVLIRGAASHRWPGNTGQNSGGTTATPSGGRWNYSKQPQNWFLLHKFLNAQNCHQGKTLKRQCVGPCVLITAVILNHIAQHKRLNSVTWLSNKRRVDTKRNKHKYSLIIVFYWKLCVSIDRSLSERLVTSSFGYELVFITVWVSSSMCPGNLHILTEIVIKFVT